MADIPQLVDFPVSITVSDPENYTFALFGKDSELGMEEEPVVCVKFILHELGEVYYNDRLTFTLHILICNIYNVLMYHNLGNYFTSTPFSYRHN